MGHVSPRVHFEVPAMAKAQVAERVGGALKLKGLQRSIKVAETGSLRPEEERRY